jgi:hypothetical protein
VEHCDKCWNQQAIGVTVEEDTEGPNWNCNTCVHQKYIGTKFVDYVCGIGNSNGVLCKNITACDKYEKKDPSPNESTDNIKSVAERFKEVGNAAKKATGSLRDAFCTIKDSGERRQFETGAVRDIQEGKGRCDLLPLDVVSNYLIDCVSRVGNHDRVIDFIYCFTATSDIRHLEDVIERFVDTHETWHNNYTMLLEVSKHFEEGAKKYGEYNWQRGIPTHCYIDSAVRHYLKYLRGDTDEPHDRAFVWNILCCIWTCIHKPELNDYGKAEEDV